MMAYLNWKNTPGESLKQEIGSHPKRQNLLRLTLARELLPEFLERLESTLDSPGTELRVDLPRDWLIFWKIRDEESRLLLAHPEAQVWVTTVALEAAHAQALLGALRRLGETAAPDTLTLGELAPAGAVGSVSNVEIVISVV